MNSIELSIFSSRIEAICDEMGAVLRRAAFSPNIRDRLDYSCAVFDAAGQLCAQAAHIPVHLGSMAYAMTELVGRFDWQAGDMVIVNDPYLGGTHLPDITLIAPVLVGDSVMGFVANRAHHADIGAQAPGSMPLSRCLQEEGVIIPPTRLLQQGLIDQAVFDALLAQLNNPEEEAGDFLAQISANRVGVAQLARLVEEFGRARFGQGLTALNAYGERLAAAVLSTLPEGVYRFGDVLDDDGMGNQDIAIVATMQVAAGKVHVDFTGTAAQVAGNINCPLSVAAAAVYYVFRCLMPAHAPACAGSFRAISLSAPKGCLLNATFPAAVAAGNVETSSRVVDVMLGLLQQALPTQIPAASQGTMNNLAMGARAGEHRWDYYETLGGGMGAGAAGPGLSGVQTHMTNTLNTPIEVLEMRYPLRVLRYQLRHGSGGAGRHAGGDGLVREYGFCAPADVTLLTERRRHGPWGVAGGADGSPGRNLLNGQPLEAKVHLRVLVGDVLTVETPGGGGWGAKE